MSSFEKVIQYRFKDEHLLDQALTHPSVFRHTKNLTFERLEFLGDRVLGLVVATMLYRECPHEPEGSLAKRYAALVCRYTLVSVAEEIKLEKFLKQVVEKSINSSRRHETILADACEALIAAIYLDGGFEAAAGFIESYWKKRINIEAAPPRDSKTTLQEWVQAKGKKHPTYKVIKRTGPAHAPHFVVQVNVEGLEPIQAGGASKRMAEQAAAEKLLETLENT